MKTTGYLFVHFIGDQEDGEQVYFSVSRDGLHWQDLNHGNPVLYSTIGEKGVRDPYLIRSPWQKEGEPAFYLIATDLRIGAGKGWQVAQYEGSRDIIVWTSENLTDWAGPFARIVAVEGAGCAWAPEAIYDEERDAILVYWASMTKYPEDSVPRQRIFASYTKDFKSFTKPFLFLESKNHVIDTTIIRGKDGYYRYSKDETEKNIRIDFGTSLVPEAFKKLPSATLQDLYGVEGPEIFKLNDCEEWCLIVDQFAAQKGYLPMLTDDLKSGHFSILEEAQFDMGPTCKRHGGVLNITEEEYQSLCARFCGNRD